MSFAGLLGAGLLGGVANAAKGVGDKIREMALVDQAQVNAVALQTQSDDAQSARDDVGNAAAIDLANVKSANRTSELTVSGLINKDLTLSSQNNAAKIANEAADKAQGFKGINQDQLAAIAQAQLKLKNTLEAATASQTASNLQASQIAQLELTALINSTSEALKVTTDAVAVDKAAIVAATTAEKLAGTQMDMAVYDTGVNKDVAAALVKSQQETAAKLSETRMAELTANNAAAIAQINVAKVGDVQGFYNMTTGTEQMHVLDKNGNWIPKGGPKAIPAASKGSYTFENVVIDGKEVTGYMNGTDFVVVGTPVDDDTKNSNSWDAEKVTKFANKQSWLQMGVSLNKFGDPVGEIGPDERAKVSSNTAAIVKAWKADTSVDLATVMDNVFTGKTTGSTGGSTAEAQDLIKAQNAITDGAPFDTVVKSLKQKYPNIDTSGLKKK